ncbi:MAG: MJ1477/TM1410 family putative glycoside hydrolase [Dehalococcoidia bacterium]
MAAMTLALAALTAQAADRPDEPLPTQPPGAATTLKRSNDFLYQLQGINLAAIGRTRYDLVVIDYSSDGSESGEFSAHQVERLKHSPGGRKFVLSYISIGEAEDYRFYWENGWAPGNPSWLGAENPSWAGNYKVRYWDPEWQQIVFAYTDRLLDAGFDGAYLDLVDAYYYWEQRGRGSAAQDMADFVHAIAAYARERDPDFYLFVQNAAELVELAGYLSGITGIGQEDIYYGYNADNQATPATVSAEMEGFLDQFKAAGKIVLTIDYATTPTKVNDAYARSRAKGYVPFVTVRALDQLTLNPGQKPDAGATCLGKPANYIGGPAADSLTGTNAADRLLGLGGADVLTGGGGDDYLCGGPGDDTCYGDLGEDEGMSCETTDSIP